jgi:hypothetical protein
LRIGRRRVDAEQRCCGERRSQRAQHSAPGAKIFFFIEGLHLKFLARRFEFLRRPVERFFSAVDACEGIVIAQRLRAAIRKPRPNALDFLAQFYWAGSRAWVCPVMVSEETSVPEKHTAMNPP